MNIYLISQSVNNGYDTYDECIVIANSEEEARLMNPDPCEWNNEYTSWAYKPEDVYVEYIGQADPKFTESQFLLTSFHAG